MTEKRYSNLDVWKMGAENTANLLNELHEENQDLEHYHDEVLKCLHKTEEDYKEQINKLHEENEQLRQDNQRLIKMLDNVANYMQKEHRETPLDDFVEWWNKMATEGLEND